jgi:2',3'-cyclic-nucleotide 2'-phosphodiesterase/3'-nucleotidase
MKKKFSLRILSTSDIHGAVLAKDYANNSITDYGLSRVSSVLKRFRNENTILMDIGDDLQGSPLMYFHQLNRSKYKNPIMTVFNYMKYDYFIPGNHDFNYGLDYLTEFVNSIEAKTLCSNIYSKDGILLFENPYKIIDYDEGPKVAIIGLTTQYIPNWENPSYIKDIIFDNAYESVKKTVEKLRGEVDLVVVAYHGGFEKDLDTNESYVLDTGENLGSKIINNVDGIDCLITAHQHRNIALEKRGISLIQAGAKGSNVAKIDIDFEFNGSWRVIAKTSELIKTSDFSCDPLIYELIKDVEDDCQLFLDKQIGNVVLNNLEVKNMFLARLNKHPIVTFINKVQLLYSKAMISATSLPNEVTGFSKDITVRNVLSTYIYANTLSVLEVSGEILRKILEKNAEYFICEEDEIKVNPRFYYPKLQHYNYDMFDGIEYIIDIDKEFGGRIVDLKYKNKDVKSTDIFTLVVNNYRASGGGDFDEYKNLKVIRSLPFDIAELIIDYIIAHRDLKIENYNNIKIISKKC